MDRFLHNTVLSCRGVQDESGEQFVAYFLPTESTLEKRREDVSEERPYDEDFEYEYMMAREYNWTVKSKASRGYEENYFLVLRQDGAYFNELETRFAFPYQLLREMFCTLLKSICILCRVRLSKRRQKIGQAQNITRLVVRHRPLDEKEYEMHRLREQQLEDTRQ